MKTDWVTKILLIIIAGCLLFNIARELTTSAQAGSGVQDINIAQVFGRRYHGGGHLPVVIIK